MVITEESFWDQMMERINQGTLPKINFSAQTTLIEQNINTLIRFISETFEQLDDGTQTTLSLKDQLIGCWLRMKIMIREQFQNQIYPRWQITRDWKQDPEIYWFDQYVAYARKLKDHYLDSLSYQPELIPDFYDLAEEIEIYSGELYPRLFCDHLYPKITLFE